MMTIEENTASKIIVSGTEHTTIGDDTSSFHETTSLNSSSIGNNIEDTNTDSNESPIPPKFSEITCPSSGTSIGQELTTNNDITTSEMEVVNEEGSHSSSMLLGFEFVGDNIDKNVNSRHMKQDRQTQSMYYYHSYAVCDRTSICGLSESVPNLKSIPVLSIPVTKILPSDCDQQSLLHNFTILISRLITNNFPYFEENYGNITIRHISHDFYKEMSQKSETVQFML